MTLPRAVEALWNELEAARAQVLREVEGLTQAQADYRPGDREWSVGEVLDHLTVAEVATGKLTTKLTREAEAAGAMAPHPTDLPEYAPPPPWPPGPAEAPQVVWPGHGKPVGELLATMQAVRARSRQSVEKLTTLDATRLVFKHFRLGDLHLGQWWRLQAAHDLVHLEQLRQIKRAPGFPKA